MPTQKQKEAIAALFKDKDKQKKNWVKEFDEDDFIEKGDLAYLGNRELGEIKDILKRGGYERLG